MLAEDFARRLRAELESACLAQTTAIAVGTPQTFEQYRERVGHLRGLNEALAKLKTLEDQLAGPAQAASLPPEEDC